MKSTLNLVNLNKSAGCSLLSFTLESISYPPSFERIVKSDNNQIIVSEVGLTKRRLFELILGGFGSFSSSM